MENDDEVGTLEEAPVINIDLRKTDRRRTSALMFRPKRFAHWPITARLALTGGNQVFSISQYHLKGLKR